MWDSKGRESVSAGSERGGAAAALPARGGLFVGRRRPPPRAAAARAAGAALSMAFPDARYAAAAAVFACGVVDVGRLAGVIGCAARFGGRCEVRYDCS